MNLDRNNNNINLTIGLNNELNSAKTNQKVERKSIHVKNNNSKDY